MNDFAEWMKKVGLRPHDVAEAWGVQDSAIWKVTHREASRLSDKNVLRVWLFTGGEVRLDPVGRAGFYPPKPKSSEEYGIALKAIRAAEDRRHLRLTEGAPLTLQQKKLRERDTGIYARWRKVRNFSQVGQGVRPDVRTCAPDREAGERKRWREEKSQKTRS